MEAQAVKYLDSYMLLNDTKVGCDAYVKLFWAHRPTPALSCAKMDSTTFFRFFFASGSKLPVAK